MARLPLVDRRQRFIDATIHVVAEEGVARASTRRIAEVANAPAASLHYVFHTKEDLFQAVFEASSSAGIRWAGKNVEPGMGLREGVKVILDGYLDWMLNNRSMQQAQFELVFWALRSPASQHLPGRTYRAYIDATAQLLREARRETETAIDLEMLARRIVALLDGHALQWISLNDNSFAMAIEDACREVQAGLAAQLPVG